MAKLLILSAFFVSVTLGQNVVCRDARGLPVTVIPAQIPDIGQAALGPLGQPIIYFNVLWARELPDDVVTFFLYHECGHHALGHTLGAGYPLTNEQAADCWAARTLVNSGVFDDDDITEVQRAIAQLGRGDWTHLPGPMRAMNLRACLGGDRSNDDDDSDTGSSAKLTCTVTRTEIDDVDDDDVKDEVGESVLDSDSATVIRRAIRKQQDDLNDAIDECKEDLESARRHPRDRDLADEVMEDRKKIALKRAVIKALQDRLDDVQ